MISLATLTAKWWHYLWNVLKRPNAGRGPGVQATMCGGYMSARPNSTSIPEPTKDCPELHGTESLGPGSRSDNGLLGPSNSTD